MKSAELLERGLRTLDATLPRSVSDRLLDYLALLEKWNRTINLTAIRERERMVTQHLLDSLSVLPVLGTDPGALADVGSGAGLPGIPLAIARPAWRVSLIEPNQKKVAFLRQAKLELGLENVTVLGQRVEEIALEQGYAVVISRAFADLPDFVKVGERLLAPGGRLIAMKGVVPYEEIARLPAHARSQVEPITVPELSATRHLIIVRFESAAASSGEAA